MLFFRLCAPVLALVLAACGGASDQQGATQSPEVAVETVKSEPVTLTQTLPGRISPYETSEVRPQVSGLITARLFQEGDNVKKGQPLYTIDAQPYVSQVASARAALARARAAIASSAALKRRYGDLVKINAIARQDYENAVTGAEQAEADVAAQQAMLRSAEIDLARTTIRAPIAGRIGRSIATTGALVTSGQADALTSIQRLNPIYVDVEQSSAALLALRQRIMAGEVARDGDAARVQLKLEDGSAYPIPGRFQFADVTVNPATGTQTIRAIFDNPRGLLLPGMYVQAELVEGVQANAITVPQRAVSRDEKGKATVLVVGKDNKVEQRSLEAIRTIGDRWLIAKGLKVGERVIVEGGMMLRPGAIVKAVSFREQPSPAQKAG